VLGIDRDANVSMRKVIIEPERVGIGESVAISFEITNMDFHPQRVLAHLRIHFVKANGKTSLKVFKMKLLELAPQETAQITKSISFAEMTTRKHYPGTHKLEIVLNGSARPLGAFQLVQD